MKMMKFLIISISLISFNLANAADYNHISGIEKDALLHAYKLASKKMLDEKLVKDIVIQESITEIYPYPIHSCFDSQDKLNDYAYYRLMYSVYIDKKLPSWEKSETMRLSDIFDDNCELSSEGKVWLERQLK